MAESVSQRFGGISPDRENEQLRKLLAAAQTDIAALAASLNQLITDYNANATIATDTTATAVTPTFTA